ncbi:hypothetical protein EZS27_019936 [termite gut metagenome]|uniref:Uncharacterized protein n=1 Tax=termite gut metagenome TaxID=433724 RepID=A0A5J4RE36_9ZZZZ
MFTLLNQKNKSAIPIDLIDISGLKVYVPTCECNCDCSSTGLCVCNTEGGVCNCNCNCHTTPPSQQEQLINK